MIAGFFLRTAAADEIFLKMKLIEYGSSPCLWFQIWILAHQLLEDRTLAELAVQKVREFFL
jgi:hypothetical protein